MNELIQQLRKVLATNFSLYLKTHMFHWNVEGPNFNDYHAFWAGVYEDVFAQNDILAEYIRQAGEYAPGSLSVYSSISDVKDEENFPKAEQMFNQFMIDNATMIRLFEELYHIHHYETPDGILVQSDYEDTKIEVTNLEYEEKLNDAKREVKMLRSVYLNQFVTQYQNLITR